jgi:Gas vesicle synthesis protein GvpL/GvpF
MKLYVYCLAEGVDDLESPVAGISGSPVRLLKIEDWRIMISDNDMEAVPVTRENALAHAAVVRSLLDRTTPLPFRFGTLVTEEQLRSYVATRKAALDARLAMVRGCIEMSVKIIWESPDDNQPEPRESDREPSPGAGAAFLAKKRRAILGDERRSAQAEEIAEWLHKNVSGLIRDEQVTVRPSEKLVLAAAHLIERANIKQYREIMAEARKQRPELHFLLSGPWPPYSFANIELEFKTQFGVS